MIDVRDKPKTWSDRWDEQYGFPSTTLEEDIEKYNRSIEFGLLVESKDLDVFK